jgi:hypothetical protein
MQKPLLTEQEIKNEESKPELEEKSDTSDLEKKEIKIN